MRFFRDPQIWHHYDKFNIVADVPFAVDTHKKATSRRENNKLRTVKVFQRQKKPDPWKKGDLLPHETEKNTYYVLYVRARYFDRKRTRFVC